MKTNFSKLNHTLLITLVCASFFGCGSSKSDSTTTYDTSTAEVTGGAISGAASSSDSGGSVVAMDQFSTQKSVSKVAQVMQSLVSVANASVCTSSAAVIGAGCSTAVMSLPMGGCTGLNLISWNGTATLTYNSGTACSNANTGGLISMGANNSVTITSPLATQLTASIGTYSLTSTSDASGYSSSVGGGTQITCGASGCTTGRTVNIAGVNRILSKSGSALYNHTISTPTALTITGVGANKQITSGSVQIQHNLAKYTAVSSVSSALTFSSGCCNPTGGTLTTTFTGSKTGTETLTFGPTCGTASVNGNTVTLSYCN